MILAVVGSRSFTNYDLLVSTLWLMIPDEIVSGGAKGADALAARYAREYNIPLTEYLPDWKTYGKSAGFRRNALIVARATHLLAFWDGVSRGTAHSIELARKRHIPVTIKHF